MTIALILLAGGTGSRMGASIPKQFLTLHEKTIAHYSLEIFQQIDQIVEIVVVAATEYRHFFPGMKCAEPGIRRQDSVYNGFLQVDPKHKWILTHDAARPFFTVEMVEELIVEGKKTGAATLAVPVKPTIKERCEQGFITKTLERSKLVEIQTPQFLSRNIMEEGFRLIEREKRDVTDDTALAELQGIAVKMVRGSYFNLKITTPDDLAIAESFLSKKSLLV